MRCWFTPRCPWWNPTDASLKVTRIHLQLFFWMLSSHDCFHFRDASVSEQLFWEKKANESGLTTPKHDLKNTDFKMKVCASVDRVNTLQRLNVQVTWQKNFGPKPFFQFLLLADLSSRCCFFLPPYFLSRPPLPLPALAPAAKFKVETWGREKEQNLWRN